MERVSPLTEMKSVVFVTWDGPQTFYLENLFFPLFRGLNRDEWSFEVVQLTWGEPKVLEARQQAAKAAAVPLHVVTVNRSHGIPGQLLAVLRGALTVRKLVLARPNTIVMFRSIMPALVMRVAHVSQLVALVYDSDGLPVDEKLESGEVSNRSLLHHTLESCEAWALKNASVILARTKLGASELERKLPAAGLGEKIRVVSNGRTEIRGFSNRCFSEPRPQESNHLVLCYLGSWGAGYRPQIMLDIAQQIRGHFPETEFRIFTGDIGQAQCDLAGRGLESVDWVTLQTLAPEDVASNLAQCDIGFSLRKRTRSTQAVSPVKLGEYLQSGLAIVGDLVGDSTLALARDNLLYEPQGPGDKKLSQWVFAHVLASRSDRQQRARVAAQTFFSIEQSITDYEKALRAAERWCGADFPR